VESYLKKKNKTDLCPLKTTYNCAEREKFYWSFRSAISNCLYYVQQIHSNTTYKGYIFFICNIRANLTFSGNVRNKSKKRICKLLVKYMIIFFSYFSKKLARNWVLCSAPIFHADGSRILTKGT